MIRMSPSAVGEVKRLRLRYLRQSQTAAGVLRLSIQTSGCSGLSYQMEFQAQAQPQDHLCQCGGLEVVIDPQSLPYIEGLVIDYTEDLMGGGFRFHNPQATQTCGCGHSFAIAQSAGAATSP